MKRPARIVSSVFRKNPERPATVNITSEATNTFIFPNLSARYPIPMPVIATASAGRVTSNDIVTIEASGKASLIGLSAGATAAAPIRTIIEEQSSVISVSLLGLNPFLISLTTRSM